MSRAAVAQAQKQQDITATESLELVKCLLRISIYHVSCGAAQGAGGCWPLRAGQLCPGRSPIPPPPIARAPRAPGLLPSRALPRGVLQGWAGAAQRAGNAWGAAAAGGSRRARLQV